MMRLDRLCLGCAAVFLATGAMLIELLGFRLLVSVLGTESALICAVILGAALVLGANLLGPRKAQLSMMEARARAAHLAGLTSASWSASIITFTWVSQKVARSVEESNSWRLAVMAVFWLATNFFAGGALASLFRGTDRSRLGRLAWLEALGAALAFLVAGGLLHFGAPRAALGVSGLVAFAALLFGVAARPARAEWALLATTALAVGSLLIGDVWVPWLKFRSHNGRRSNATARYWSVGGLVSVHRANRRTLKVSTDRGSPATMGRKMKKSKRPSFQPTDLTYYSDPKPSGRALVIGSGSGHEVASALAHGHQKVDVVVANSLVAEGAWLGYGLEHTKGLYDDPELVRITVGDGRKLIRSTPPKNYQRIIVAQSERFTADPLRLLATMHGRRFTSEAIGAYFRVLEDDGLLLLDVPAEEVPAVLAAAKVAFGGQDRLLRERSFVCARRKGGGSIVLLHAGKFDAKARHKLKRRCRRGRLDLSYPLEVVRKGHRDFEKKKAERALNMSRAEGGQASSDDRPFVAPASATFKEDLRTTLGALKPGTVLRRRRAIPRARTSKPKKSLPVMKDKTAGKDKKKVKSKVAQKRARAASAMASKPARLPEPKITSSILALVMSAVVLFVVLVTWLLPYRREEGALKPQRALRWSLPCFGAALAMGSMLVLDALVTELGVPSLAYSLLLPSLLAGAAASRLFVDGSTAAEKPAPNDRSTPRVSARGVLLSAVIAMGLVLPFAFADPLVISVLHSVKGLELVSAGGLAMLVGAALGYPMAAGLRAVGMNSAVAVSASWAAHRAGWLFGVAVALTLTRYVGVSVLGLLATIMMASGCVLFLVGARHAPELSASPE